MKSATETSSDQIRLLSTYEVDELASVVADVVSGLASPLALSLTIWDQDLDAPADTFVFGRRKREFKPFAEAFADDYSGSPEKMAAWLVDADCVNERLPDGLAPVVALPIETDGRLCAILLVAGDDENEAAALAERLAQYPVATAIDHCWQYRELIRENERLRNQYEQLESSIQHMEEQTRKIIHDMQASQALRTTQIQRDKMLFGISNAVRGSLMTQEVLQRAVYEIGTQLRVSHCVLVRAAEGGDEFMVYEYCDDSVGPVRDLFYTPAGQRFMAMARSRGAPQDFGDPFHDTEHVYERDFLIQLGMRSGLLIPLIVRDATIGAVLLLECREPRDWEIDLAAFLGALFDQVSVAIENADLHEEKERQARTDGLTGVANRRHFNEAMQLEFERARRYALPLSLVVFDLDFLKKINDTYGHKAGDEAIKAIARVINSGSRSIDIVARYGGEEFCLLLPNTDLEMAVQIAERMRLQISEEPVDGQFSISASIGVASYPDHAGDPEELFHKADEALYRAKESGRNRVVVA